MRKTMCAALVSVRGERRRFVGVAGADDGRWRGADDSTLCRLPYARACRIAAVAPLPTLAAHRYSAAGAGLFYKCGVR
jgi:hypothetical protein